MKTSLGIKNPPLATEKKKVKEGETARVLHCDLVVTGSKIGNSLFTCEERAAYNDLPQTLQSWEPCALG